MNLSSHASRWVVAAIAAPVLLSVIFLGPAWLFALVVAVFGVLAWWEFFDICLPGAGMPLRLLGILGWLAVAAGALFIDTPGQQGGLILAVGSGAMFFVLRYQHVTSVVDTAARFFLGHAYITFFFSFLILLFKLDFGPRWILFALLVTFLGDTSAYYAGRNLGRYVPRKLHPALSPKKTWIGLAGGVLGSGLVAGVMTVLMLPADPIDAVILGLFLGLWCAGGDLFESMFKRVAGIKDSGRILMGHGGVWDRIDALLFSTPVIYFFALFQSA